jgi:glutaredoxin 3
MSVMVNEELFEATLVKLYVVPECPLCTRARLWLEQHRIDYLELNVAAKFGAFRAMYKLTRQRLVPVVEAKGRALVRPTAEELTKFLL